MNLIDNKNNLTVAVKALKKLHLNHQKKSQFKEVFEDEETSRCRINLVLSLCKIPSIRPDGKARPITVKSDIPYSYVDDLTEVLLVTKNLRGSKKDFDPAVHLYQDLLREHNAASLISQVMPIGKIKYEHSEFEAKRALANRFDIVLGDAAIIKLLPAILGKSFYKKKKRPIAINMKAKNIRKEIEDALSKVYLHMNLEGSSCMTQVARLDQSEDEVASNVLSVVGALKVKGNVPGGWENVRSIHIKTDVSKAIPLYLNPASPSAKPVKHPNAKKIERVEGEISTLADKLVSVRRTGDVKVIQKKIRKRVSNTKALSKLAREEDCKFDKYNPVTNAIVKGTQQKRKRNWDSMRIKHAALK